MWLTRDTHLMQQFIYYYKQLYMFRASICPSSRVLGCIRIILLHMVSSTRCFGWGSEEPVCSLVHWCKFCIRLYDARTHIHQINYVVESSNALVHRRIFSDTNKYFIYGSPKRRLWKRKEVLVPLTLQPIGHFQFLSICLCSKEIKAHSLNISSK